jgi:hypothetical protein
MQNLEDAMAIATASHPPVDRKLTTNREEYQAARADLDARARAGKTVQGRNSKGHFTKGVKVSTFAKDPAKSADEMLMRLFPKWRGDFGAPVIASIPKTRGPSPAVAQVLVGA